MTRMFIHKLLCIVGKSRVQIYKNKFHQYLVISHHKRHNTDTLHLAEPSADMYSGSKSLIHLQTLSFTSTE